MGLTQITCFFKNICLFVSNSYYEIEKLALYYTLPILVLLYKFSISINLTHSWHQKKMSQNCKLFREFYFYTWVLRLKVKVIYMWRTYNDVKFLNDVCTIIRCDEELIHNNFFFVFITLNFPHFITLLYFNNINLKWFYFIFTWHTHTCIYIKACPINT